MKTIQDICCVIDRKTGKSACPLQNAEISVVIGSTIAEVTLVQNYINTGNGNIEALYTFPLPHNAQVISFNGKIGENEVRGEFREKEEAFKEYDDAVRRGDSAFLLESHRPDIFKISLGNIVPGEKASITISYMEDVKIIDNELRWVLPTVVAPRYIPGDKSGTKTGMGTMMPTDRVPDADYITPPMGDTAYTLKIRAVLSGLNEIKMVSSPSHPVEVLFKGNDVIVSLAKETELLDSDFILSVFLDADEKSSYVTAADRGSEASGSYGQGDKTFETAGETVDVSNQAGQVTEAYGSARLMIEIDDAQEKQNHYEYTFMIDISGSMTGEKLDQAKRAMVISLRNLLEGDYFNIVAFESNFSCFSKEAVPYSQQNLEKADSWIAALTELGGTEIYRPLRVVLEDNVYDLERVVLLFTDGQVGNENEIIALVKKHNRSLQFFPFGIDTAVNKHFIDSLAEAGNGMPEYIYPGERIEDKVIRQFSRVHQLYLANPAASGKDGTELETIPPMPARIYGSEVYSFVMRSEKLSVLEEIKICGKIEGKNTEIVLKSNVTDDARLLALKWAKGKIKLLEGQLGSDNLRRNSLVKQEIINLSIKYSLLSTLTSLVAVHKRMVKGTGLPETIVVPVQKPRGWDMFDEPSDVKHYMARSVVTEASMRSYSYMDASDDPEMPGFLRNKNSNRSGAARIERKGRLSERNVLDMSLHTSMPAFIPKLPSLQDIIRNAAQSQNADGAFGAGSEMNRRTAFFVIGMLLTGKEWRPYRIQIMKAGEALLKSGSSEPLLRAVAFSLLLETKLLQGNEAQTVMNVVVSNLSRGDKIAFEAFKAGDFQALSGIIAYKFTGSFNKSDLMAWLLERV